MRVADRRCRCRPGVLGGVFGGWLVGGESDVWDSGLFLEILFFFFHFGVARVGE